MGDSHSYDLFHAVACFLVQLYDHDYSQEFPYAQEAEAFAHLEQHVEHYKPPECLPLLEGTMLCQIRVNRGQVQIACMHSTCTSLQLSSAMHFIRRSLKKTSRLSLTCRSA